MHDGVDAAQGMAKREVIVQVAQGDLDSDPLGTEAARGRGPGIELWCRRPSIVAAAPGLPSPWAPVSSSTDERLPLGWVGSRSLECALGRALSPPRL